MNKGKGNRQQKKGQRTGKGTYNRKGGKDQDKIREPKQDSETKARFGNQSKIRETNKIPGKTQRLPGISIEI